MWQRFARLRMEDIERIELIAAEIAAQVLQVRYACVRVGALAKRHAIDHAPLSVDDDFRH